ncbi:lysophospholipid acyltransferase family protein [Actinomyces minihominis]|uniref:lysophospholipid acyltransferase family protein n=1 Tax=Actinomyces minihominis TaxID=2002838 RepID=UPI000C083C2B|nr:lysophospholipid acyltransferase family protein [Actinomyces minihominis]
MTQKGARPRKGNIKGMYRFGYHVLKPVVNLLSRPQWYGVENLPKEGAFILAPNHMSNFDPVSMGYFMADNGYEVRFLAKHSLFKVPVIGPFFRWWGMIPVMRDSAEATDALKYARAALDAGDVVGIYFEGTLTRDPAFWPMKGKTGLARLALDTRIPIVPVVQWGAQDIMDRYAGLSLHRRRPGLFIRVLPPIDFSDIEGDSTNHEGVRELTARLQKALGDASEELRGEAQPLVPWNMKERGGPSKNELKSFSKWRRSLAKANRKVDILPAQPSFDRD